MEENIPPTRAVLLAARRDLALAREGYDLLDRKRQALIAHTIDMLAGTEPVEEELAEQFAAAYQALSQARISMGVEHVAWAALTASRDARVDITERSVMGVPVPTVRAGLRPFRLEYSLSGTTASLDRATQAFSDLFAQVCRAAELRISVWRLAREIRRMQRRVNALKNVLIPRYEAIVGRVQAVLEEREREDIYRAKAVKRALEKEEARERDGAETL